MINEYLGRFMRMVVNNKLCTNRFHKGRGFFQQIYKQFRWHEWGTSFTMFCLSEIIDDVVLNFCTVLKRFLLFLAHFPVS